MDELDQDMTLLDQDKTLAEQFQDIRDGINDAAIELTSTLDDILEEIEEAENSEVVSREKLNWIDDPAGMLQMYLEKLGELHRHLSTLHVLKKKYGDSLK